MKKKTLLILGIAGLGLFFLNKGTGEENQQMQTISGGGGGYSASMGLQEPAGLGSVPAQPTIVYATNLEAPNFPTGESATTTTSKKTTTSGGTPTGSISSKVGGTYNPTTGVYKDSSGLGYSVAPEYVPKTALVLPTNTTGMSIAPSKKEVVQPTYNWAQRTAGQAYTGWTRLTSTVKGWF